MPGRLRAEFIQDASKHGRDTLPESGEPAHKHMRVSEPTEISQESPVFPLGWSDAWDLDDAQLYSEESLLLTSEAPPSSPVPAPDTLRKSETSAEVLIKFLNALFTEQDECGPDMSTLAMVHSVQGEAALNAGALSELHGILSLCVRETNKCLTHGIVRKDDTPYHLLDVDPQMLARVLSLLDVTMRENTCEWSLSKDVSSLLADVYRSTQALLCAKCCLSIFSIDQLPKFLFSEELVAQCINVIKPALEVLVLPLMEACSGDESHELSALLLSGRMDSDAVQTLDIHIHTLSACLSLLDTMFTLSNFMIPDNDRDIIVAITDAKFIALDQLGLVGTRLRKVGMELERKRKRLTLQPMRDIVQSFNLEAMEDVDRAYHSVMAQLRQGRKNPGTMTARSFHAAQYLYELSLARKACHGQDNFCRLVADCVRRVNNTEAVRIHPDILPQLVLQSTFFIQFPSLLKAILQHCHAPALTLRTRALRAMGNIAAMDPALLQDGQIQEAVAAHLGDQSANPFSLDAKASLAVCITTLLCAYAPWTESHLDNQVDSLFAMLMRVYTTESTDPSTSPGQTTWDSLPIILLALSYLLQAYPLKFLDPNVCHAMDSVFAHGSPQERFYMLRALWGYLERDATLPQGNEQGNVQQQLAGQVKSDAGVASALMQRYAEPIFRATLDVDAPKTQQVASELVKLSVLQGLSHPMQCIPYLVALETGDNVLMRHKAVQLHRHLLGKHASMLSTRFGESILTAFRFQQHCTAAPRGVRPGTKREALMQVWYSLLSDHRQAKLQFLRALVRLLDVPQDVSPTRDDVYLSLFVADTLQLLEYRSAEEPLTILYELKMLDASSGIQIASIIGRRLRREEHMREPSPLTEEEDEDEDEDEDEETTHDQTDSQQTTKDTPASHKDATSGGPLRSTDLLSLAYAASRVEIMRYVRRTLKHMYRLSEAKCAKFEPGKRTALGDRPIAPASEARLCDCADDLPNDQPGALTALETFVEADDEMSSESELEYE
ncbi:Sister chromatid cohesion protein 2 [Malassezia equina]|uniref:Sister chromatid cohesion protein n=1 Tax=Malassezia equina TaxID=1381935 RepID=A0AAF0EBT2_9BASI|nr:Sister chromatid cohesion protein 2 [Malassezia equina]